MSMTNCESVVGRENCRRAWCQQKAIFRLYSLGSRTPFSDILESLVRRWPVSVGSDVHFIARLRDIYRREQAARVGLAPAVLSSPTLFSPSNNPGSTPAANGRQDAE